MTGGAGEIGSKFIDSIIKSGNVAVCADISIKTSITLIEKFQSTHPGLFEFFELDINDTISINRLIIDLMQRHGKIDAVVNNAYPRNKNYGRKLEDVTYEDFCENVNNHLGGYFLIAQQFCKVFKDQGYGNLINMSSIYGSMAPRFDIYEGTSMTMPVEYAAVKSAIENLTKYFAKYYKKYGIRVNSVSPGGIFTDQPSNFIECYKMYCGTKGMLSSEDIAGTLMFLLSDEARYITGQNLIVDDGFSL